MSFNSDYSALRKKRLREMGGAVEQSPLRDSPKPLLYSSRDIAPTREMPEYTPRTNKVTTKQNATQTKQTSKQDEATWFKSGAFADGSWDAFDLLSSIGSTVGDAALGIVKGAAKTVEGITDLALYGASEIAGIFDEDAEKEVKSWAQHDTVDAIAKPADDYLDENSFLGDKMEGVEEGIGQVAAMIVTGGIAGVAGVSATAATTATMFASSMGSGIGEALDSGASDEEAWAYGAISGTVDALSEMIFGGLGKGANALGYSSGLLSADDMLANALTSKMKSGFAKNLVQFGVKAGAEGLEEVIAGIGSAAAKKLTYMSEEDWGKLIEDEQLLDQFIVGSITSGIAQSGFVPGMKKGSLREANAKGRDFITGYTTNEQKVIDKVVEDRIAEAKKNGEKVDEGKIREAVEEELKSGYISIDTIEETLGGESYKAYKDLIDKDNAAIEELKELYGEKAVEAEFESRVAQAEQNGQTLTNKQKEELREQIVTDNQKRLEEEVKSILSASKRGEVRDALNAEMQKVLKRTVKGKTQSDSYLLESYAETARRGVKFEADVSQYKDENARKTIQNIIDAGVANNTNRTHQLANTLAKIAADKGIIFSVTDAKRLAGTRFGVDGKTVNGYVENGNITINVDSPKYLHSVVGHEISHVLEGNKELYQLLQNAAFEFAKGRKSSNGKFDNEYMERLFNTTQLYKDVDGYKGADGQEKIKREVVSDLVGDYLFTDSKFIQNLSTKHRNLFQKIFDEIKYLWKIATAGSKEKRELEKLKRAFEDAYRADSKSENKTEGEKKYSLSDSDGKKLTKAQSEYFKDSKMRDADGNLMVMYHGSRDAGFHVFDPAHSDDDTSLFFVDRNDVAASYSGTSETYEAQSIRTADDMNKFLAKIGYDHYEAVEKDGKFELLENNEHVAFSDTAKGIYEEFCWYEGVGDGDVNYKVYLNLTNPLEIDAKGRPWNKIDAEFSQEVYEKYQSLTAEEKAALTDLAEWEDFRLFNSEIQEAADNELASAYEKMGEDCNIYDLFSVAADNFSEESMRENARKYLKTRDFAQRAKDGGYDGVIFKNIVDNGGYSNGSEGASTVAIAFDSNQIKSVANENPTGDPDIRYSLSSIASSFFGDENMSAYAFREADYTKTQGYKDYVNQCVNNMKQSRPDIDEVSARREIKASIDGIIQVALAAKQAGYDIYDDATKRGKRDSKNRLLFSSLEPNSDYFTSNDISTICDKRKNFAEIYDDIVRAEEAKGVPQGKRFFDNVDNYFFLHKLMADKGLTQPCRQCYVESMRKNLAPMANAFLRLVGETNPNNTANDQLYQQKGKNKGELKSNNAATREWVLEKLAEYDMTAGDLTVEMLTTEDGLAQLKIQAPLIYEAFNSFYGQSKPKMPKSATPFRFGELTALLTDNKGRIKKSLVDKINSTGGFRLQSYSDFQIQNYTDVLQVIFEAGTLGLNGHAYTKVPAFLDATEGTNLKRNISIFMYKDGNEWKLDRNDSFPYTLEEIYEIVKADKTGNTSIIAVSQNNEMSAWIMANDLVGYGIPFHKSGMKMGTVRDTDIKTEDGRIVKGYKDTKDHTKQQTEVWAKTTADHKALTKVKNGINIYEFWDFDNVDGLSKNELIEKNVKAYIDACDSAGYIPKFRDYVMNNGKVLNDVLRFAKEMGYASPDATIEDISFEYKGYTIPYGYYKFLGDFGMFTPEGNASPQQPLSLHNYDFAKAVEFFGNSEELHRNEILQQFANGDEREYYRNSDLTAEQLEGIVRQKRGEIAQDVVDRKYSLSADGEAPTRYGDLHVRGEDVKYVPMQEDIAPVKEEAAPAQNVAVDAPEEDEAMFPNDVSLQQLKDEVEALKPQIEAAYKANDREGGMPLYERYRELMDEIERREAQDAAMQDERFSTLTDADAPAEMDAPYYGESETLTADDPFENRDMKAVSRDRKTKAYMYENPEVKPFFQQEAAALLGELERTEKPQTFYNGWMKAEMSYEFAQDIPEIYRTKRVTTPDIAYLRDYVKMSYADIEKGLKAIIEDNGAENIAAAKKIEFVLNDRLLHGYNEDGYEVPPNQDYINLINEKQISEYSEEARKQFFEVADEYAPEDIAPVAEKYEAIRPKQSNEPRMARVKEDIAPTYETKRKDQLDGQRTMFPEESEAPVDEKVATVLTEEPEVAEKDGRVISKARAYLLDKQSAIEDLALKTKNRELMGKANFMLSSESRAQTFIGEGRDGVRALNDVRTEVENAGLTEQFQDYMYHKHNVDRMSLESKAQATLTKLQGKFGHLETKQIYAIANTEITDKTTERTAQTIREAKEYLNALEAKNKPVFGDSVTAEVSQQAVAEFEKAHPEFKAWAKDVYGINEYLRKMLVDAGVISQETADLWSTMYPNYVPIRRDGKDGAAINVPLDTNRTGVDAPIKRATGGNSDILPLFNTMATRVEQTFRAVAKNNFGIELMNTLGAKTVTQMATLDDVIDSFDNHDELLQKGENGAKPTFTVFKNGERVTFEITEDLYDALAPTPEWMKSQSKTLGVLTDIQRGLLTEYNPVFLATNFLKDFQDVWFNSQHSLKTYANMPLAFWELLTKGKWYKEYMENGGSDLTYFDGKKKTFTKEDTGLKWLIGLPFRAISAANNFIERLPRLAEYIASCKNGASIEVAMLDAARVTTNFAAGGDFTKMLNRNGFTFLNASVQGFNQQVRNFREAKANGLKGILTLAAKFAIAGLPVVLLNHLLWGDDEEYEELSDYVKDSYYIVGKRDDGTFVRIPKGRTTAVIQSAFDQMDNLVTGDDEVDLARFGQLLVENLAPNNPLDNNIAAPLIQAATNKTWYGEDLVPTRLQDLPAAEQFDETTDSLSKWLAETPVGEFLDWSPYKINYVLNQYSGGVGDVFLPMMTPKAESGDNSFKGNIIAPWKDKFVTDSTLKNQKVSDFYDTVDELEKNANSMYATDEDTLKYKYMNSINADLGELYQQKREIQNSDLPDDEKYNAVREVQRQIDDLSKEALNTYNNVSIDGVYATVGDRHYRWYEPGEDSDAEAGWQKLTAKQLEKQEEVTSGLGISASEYWRNKEEYDYAYDSPAKYAIAKSVGGYKVFKQYSSELYDIKADKDEDGKSISGSRKEKVIEYINNLDADYYAKIILYKSEYNADDTYNYEIIEYLNSRDDISFEEMAAILKELGFTVDSEGNISW